MNQDVWLVAGLGNPGDRYSGNRHNVGFMVADLLAERAGGSFKNPRGGAWICETRLGPRAHGMGTIRVVLVKPGSFMNLSGSPVAQAMRFFSVPVTKLIVVHDELDVPFGVIRVKRGGGDGGHNGLRSITRALHTPDYLRVRMGIGRPSGAQPPADFVLSDFPLAARRELPDVLERGADAVEALLVRDLAAVQNEFHSLR